MTVSVLIPCYNREGSLPAAIESASAQSAPPAEIVVVDDGSTDGSAAVAEGFGPPVRVVRQANGGAAAARNRGLAECRGEWVAFLDSDDIWAPDKLERQLAAAAAVPDADLVFCDTRTRAGSAGEPGAELMPSRFTLGGVRDRGEPAGEGLLAFDRSHFEGMLERCRVITSAVLVRRGLPGLHFPEHIWGSEDWAVWLNLILTHRFVAVDEILVTMYAGGDNLTGNVAKLMRNDLKVLDDLLGEKSGRRPPLTGEEAAAVRRVRAARRLAAVYHALRAGDGPAARAVLRSARPGELSAADRLKYRAAAWLPGPVLRTLAARS